MVIAFYITAIKVLMGRLFFTVIMSKIISQLWRAIIGDAFNQVYVSLTTIDTEKVKKKKKCQYCKVPKTNLKR